MPYLPKLPISGSATVFVVALWSASTLAQTAPAGAIADPKPVQPATKPTTSTKPLTPQGPLASKPAPTVVSPDSKNLATRPLPAATTPPPAASTKPPAAPTPGGKKCGERKGDC